MRTKLIKVEDQYFLELTESVLRQAGIDPERPVEVSVERHRMVISQPEDPENDARFREVLEETARRHGELFRRLAQH